MKWPIGFSATTGVVSTDCRGTRLARTVIDTLYTAGALSTREALPVSPYERTDVAVAMMGMVGSAERPTAGREASLWGRCRCVENASARLSLPHACW